MTTTQFWTTYHTHAPPTTASMPVSYDSQVIVEDDGAPLIRTFADTTPYSPTDAFDL